MATASRRKGRAQKIDDAIDLPGPQPFHHAKRAFAPVDMLSEDAIQTVHDRSMELLETLGLEFMSEQAWDILETNGCTVDRSTGIATMPREVVEHWIAKAPSVFTMPARAPEKSLIMGGDHIVYGSSSGPPNSMDLDGGRRPGTQADFRSFVKLSHMLGSVGMMSGHMVEPIDVPVNTRHLWSVYDWATLSDKVHRVMTIGATRAEDGLAMTAIAHGITRDELCQAPRTLSIVSANTPRRIDGAVIDGALVLARNGQAIVVSSVAFSGAMAPVTQSGTMVLHNAETLGMIAFFQMAAPSCPVFYGSLVTPTDMRTGAPAMGVPESVIGTIIAGQLARHYGIPQRTMPGSTSNAVDAQAAYETSFSLWAGMLSGAHLMMQAHGWMEAGLTCSYEKTILDSELIQMMNALARPIDFDDLDDVMVAIKEVGPGGHFLGCDHTMSRYKTIFHAPMLSDWRPYEFWQDAGAPDTAQRANTVWKDLLHRYTPPPMDPAINEALLDYIARREREIGSSDL